MRAGCISVALSNARIRSGALSVIDYFNFDLGTALDDEAVEATINTDQFNAITHIVSGNVMRVFTTGGRVCCFSRLEPIPITPASFLVRPQTRLGSKPGVPVEDLNGAALYSFSAKAEALTRFNLPTPPLAMALKPLSVLSSHLMKDPVDLAARQRHIH
jgi:hypothetical protein